MSKLSWRRHGTAVAAVAITVTGALGASWATRASAAPTSVTATTVPPALISTSPAAQPQARQPYPGGPNTDLNRWLAAGERASQALPGEHPSVLFIGDSITEWWLNYGRASWNSHFAPLGAVDDGVVGDTTSNVLARIDAGQLPRTSPRVVVIMIGTNNIGAGQHPTEAAQGVQAVLDAVRERLPASRIVLLSVLPRDHPNSMARQFVAELDAQLAHTSRVQYVDLWNDLLQPDGQFRPGTMRPDLLHPDAGGYAAIAAPILAAIEK